jgi:hypothetical protein
MTAATSKEKIDVKIYTTKNFEIRGQISVMKAYRGRLSDMLNDDRGFIALTNVTLYDAQGVVRQKCPFLCINKQAIEYVVEQEALDEYFQLN